MKVEDVMNKGVESSEQEQPMRRSGKRLLWFLLIPVVLVTSAFIGTKGRQKTSRQLNATTKSLEVQTVNVIHPRRSKASSDLTLPGMIQAFSQSPIYARVDGYVRT